MSGIRVWIGLGLSIVLLALFFFTLDVQQLLDALRDANYVYVVPAIALYLISVWFRALRWQWLLKHIKPIKVKRLYPVVVVGYMANNLLPMRLGEFVRSYYIGEREGISKTSALVTILLERLLDAFTLILFIAIAALFVPLVGVAKGFGEQSSVPWPLLVVIISVPFLTALGSLVWMAYRPGGTRRIIIPLLRHLPATAQRLSLAQLDMMLHALKSLQSPAAIPILVLLSLPIWLLEAGMFFTIGYSFGFQHLYQNPTQMMVAMILVTAIGNIGSSIPAAPGGIGLFELVARETLVLLPLASIDRALAGGYIAVVHASLLLPMIVLGQLFLWSGQLSIRSLFMGARNSNDAAADSLSDIDANGRGR